MPITTMDKMPAPIHGGRLRAAAMEFEIPIDQWLDLSTGINPFSWQTPTIPQAIWQRLPDSYAALEAAASQYYQAPVMAIPGSQWAIQTLPTLFSRCRVWIPKFCYEEHRYWWQFQQHNIEYYDQLPLPNELQKNDIILVVNPNNPTTQITPTTELRALANALLQLQGYLIVDEAFMDATPMHSILCGHRQQSSQNVIVLKSIGKLFGLAGLRLGFIHCPENIQSLLQQRLGPWAINHPAAFLGEKALLDEHWQQENRARLSNYSAQLHAILSSRFGPDRVKSCPLFSTISMPANHAEHFYRHFAKQGILVRIFTNWGIVRIGLANKSGLNRLNNTLDCWNI